MVTTSHAGVINGNRRDPKTAGRSVGRRRRRAGGHRRTERGRPRRRREVTGGGARLVPGGRREDRHRSRLGSRPQGHADQPHTDHARASHGRRDGPKRLRFHADRVPPAADIQTTPDWAQPPPIPPGPPLTPLSEPGFWLGWPTGPLTDGGVTMLPPWVVWLGPGPLKSPPDPPGAGAPPAPGPTPPLPGCMPPPPSPPPPPAGPPGAGGAVDSVVVVDVAVDVLVEVLVGVVDVESLLLPQPASATAGTHIRTAEIRARVVMFGAVTRARRG